MLGCILIAFNLCAPPGYYGGGSYAYAQQGYYVQPQPIYVVQPQPVYVVQPQPYYGGYGYQRPFAAGPGISVGVGPRGGVKIGVGY